MTAATQGYMSPTTYSSANMFAQSGLDIPKNNQFFKTFGNGTTNRTIEPQQTEKTTSRASNLESLNTNMDGFFDFEPSTNTGSPYQDQFSTPGASGVPWSGEMNFHPLSPPDSASFSPKDTWAYGFRNPSNLMTNIDPVNTRTNYGQITPPNDDNDNESMMDCQFNGHQRRLPPSEPDSPVKKRKRNESNTNEQSNQPTRRTRKYASRNANSADTGGKPEDAKRSKFLERNRVAASKCRQKKKEWTQNLETRARELQKNNNMLRLDVESLRQEVLLLKAEMLKHSSCGCTSIQDFMKSNAGSNSFLETQDEENLFKREHSPIESMPGSTRSRQHSSFGGCDEGNSPTVEPSSVSIVDDENALEALLSSSINHDSSDEGILNQING